jgi:pimeloyl-ACP methyl ester carboxylesterase
VVVSVHVEVAGNGAGVVLIHAGICDSRMWDPQWTTLVREHRVLRLDLRGYGRSTLEPGELCHGRDVLDAMDRHGLERAALVAASMGGAVALDIALAAPERVSALALLDPALDGYESFSDDLLARWQAEEDALERGDIESAVEINVRLWVDGPGRPEGTAATDVRALVAQMQRRAFELQLAAGDDVADRMLAIGMADRLGEIGVPALVVCGEHDVDDFRDIATLVASSIPGARMETVPAAAHLPNMEQPELVEDLLVPFLLENA